MRTAISSLNYWAWLTRWRCNLWDIRIKDGHTSVKRRIPWGWMQRSAKEATTKTHWNLPASRKRSMKCTMSLNCSTTTTDWLNLKMSSKTINEDFVTNTTTRKLTTNCDRTKTYTCTNRRRRLIGIRERRMRLYWDSMNRKFLSSKRCRGTASWSTM